MFDTICTLPLTSDLFCQTLHPSESILATGLASGHVSIYRLPTKTSDGSASSEDDVAASTSSNGLGRIDTQWRTRRHESSCRSLAFNIDGTGLFSAGADGIVKFADTDTGKVKDKIAIPLDPSTGDIDAPSLIHALSPQTFLLATDSSALHLYDLRVAEKTGLGEVWTKRKPNQTHHPHTDYVSSLTPLPPSEASTSGFSKQWVSTGGTTLAVTDLRRGVLVQSEDQEELLLSSCIMAGLSAKGTSTSEKVIVGGGAGVLTLWERGQWDDQDERIVVDKGFEKNQGGESLDVLQVLPDGIGPGRTVAVGLGDGRVRFVKIGPNKVIDQVRHDDVEGVVGLGFDVEGRLITGGGSTIKVWHEKVDEDNGAYVEPGKSPTGKVSIHADSDAEDSADERDSEDSDKEDREEPQRKKRKKGGKSGHLNGKAGSFSFSGLD